MGTWKSAPSPCIDVCKYKRAGRCIGCSMTKDEKKGFGRLVDKEEKKQFFRTLIGRLDAMRALPFWAGAYRRKCERKGRACPLDKLEAKDEAIAA